jgi:uncharacterized membrane protein (UPF0127 family)
MSRRTPHFLQPLVEDAAGSFVLRHERTGRAIATTLELAGDSKSRRKGLLGRAAMAPDSALIIAPCSAVHTFFMRFSIDVVFTNRSGEIQALRPAVRPWRVAICFAAFAVVELPAGTAERLQMSVGDRVVIVGKSR